MCSGSVARQASNAGRYPGRIRLSANRCASAFSAVNAVNQALNEAESSVRVTIASVSARLAFVARRTPGQRQRGFGAPLRGRIAGVRSEDGHERQQQGLHDRQPPIVPGRAPAAASPVLLVLGDLFADLGRRQTLRHGSPAPARAAFGIGSLPRYDVPRIPLSHGAMCPPGARIARPDDVDVGHRGRVAPPRRARYRLCSVGRAELLPATSISNSSRMVDRRCSCPVQLGIHENNAEQPSEASSARQRDSPWRRSWSTTAIRRFNHQRQGPRLECRSTQADLGEPDGLSEVRSLRATHLGRKSRTCGRTASAIDTVSSREPHFAEAVSVLTGATGLGLGRRRERTYDESRSEPVFGDATGAGSVARWAFTRAAPTGRSTPRRRWRGRSRVRCPFRG